MSEESINTDPELGSGQAEGPAVESAEAADVQDIPLVQDMPEHLDWAVLGNEALRFGVKQFRPGQKRIIEAVLAGKDVLAIMPTGYGKSLCYQIPALFLPKATVVVSPLLSLMQDQQEKLADVELHAAKLNSTLSRKEEKAVAERIRAGEHELIYVTPERLEDPSAIELLKERGVSLFVIDEAHCISQWGHDFRPSYLGLRNVIEALGHPPVLMLTATAPGNIAKEILQELNVPDALVVRTGIDRENLSFEVLRAPNRALKLERLLDVIRSCEGSGIVYTASVKAADEVCRLLRENGVKAANYHARMKSRDRQETQERFMANEFRVMVATKAFGMGIDKQDIRFVVHYHFPDSLESYYQEAGRAGRDGRPSRCVLLYRRGDRLIQDFFLRRKYPSREDSKKIYETLLQLADANQKSEIGNQKSVDGISIGELATASGFSKRVVKVVCAKLEDTGVITKRARMIHVRKRFDSAVQEEAFLSVMEARLKLDIARLQSMMAYAESDLCRVRLLREYFGEEPQLDCGHCDNCRARIAGISSTAFENGQPVRHPRYGTGKVVRMRGPKVLVCFEDERTRTCHPAYLRAA